MLVSAPFLTMPYPQRTFLASASNTETPRNSAQRMAVADRDVLKDLAKRYRFDIEITGSHISRNKLRGIKISVASMSHSRSSSSPP
jgi:hypothetical protein